VRKLEGELIIYDHDRNVATSLNGFSAEVWERCDGHTSPSAIAEALSDKALGAAGAVDERAVWIAVDKLSRAKLLEEAVTIPAAVLGGSSRREMLRRVGLGLGAAAAVPVVMSVTAPTPAAATTCLGLCSPCETGAMGKDPCCPGLQCTGNSGFKRCTHTPQECG